MHSVSSLTFHTRRCGIKSKREAWLIRFSALAITQKEPARRRRYELLTAERIDDP